MCEPTTWVMIGIALVGGAVQYDASQKAQRYQERVADQNAKVADAQAVDQERLGQIEASERRLKTRLQLANQQATFGAQNVQQSGTALDILGDTAMFGEIDEGRIRANAARKAWGYQIDAYNTRANKKLMQFQGKTDRTGIILSTASSAFGAAAGGGGGSGNQFGWNSSKGSGLV